MTTEIATECLYMTVASLVFVLTIALVDGTQARNKLIQAFSVGLLCGLGTLTRTNMIFVPFLVQVLMIWKTFTDSERWRWVILSIALWIGQLTAISPWLVRNQVVLGAPVLATNLDYNLFRGTFDLAGGPPFGPALVGVFRTYNVMYEDEIENPRINQLPIDEVTNEQNARAAALQIIRSDPISWFKERFRNIIYLWLNLQWDSSLLNKQPLIIIAAVMVTLIYYSLFGFAIAGTFLIWNISMRREEKQFLLISWAFISAVTPAIIAFVGKRYRIAMIDPYLGILSCVGIACWANHFMKSNVVRE